MSGDAPPLPSFFRLVRYDAIGSTNDEAKRLARDGLPEGILVWALEQTAGRGRRGRPWASPPGNLYASLLLRPDCSAMRAAQLGFVAALALVEALEPLVGRTVELRCKWPNDVLANGRKLAGILLESETGEEDRPAFVVLGIGVNLAAAPGSVEYPATSLAAEGVAPVTPGIVLAGFARRFEHWAARWAREGFAPVREAWLGRVAALGEPIRVRLESGEWYGRFLDIDADGALLLDGEGGHRRIAAGEVFPAAA